MKTELLALIENYGKALVHQTEGKISAFKDAKNLMSNIVFLLDKAEQAQAPAAKCETCNDNGLIGGPSFYDPGEGGVPCPDCSAPAAAEPVADALRALIEAIEFTPLGIRQITALGQARAALATAKAEPTEVIVPRMTAEEVNALPEKARDYIHQLATNADPSGMVRENMQLRDVNKGLQIMYRKAADALDAETIQKAKRYDWLRHGDNDEKVIMRGPVAHDFVYLPRNEKLDALIDAAMATQGAEP